LTSSNVSFTFATSFHNPLSHTRFSVWNQRQIQFPHKNYDPFLYSYEIVSDGKIFIHFSTLRFITAWT
jgi:hypothetical protein